MSCGDTRGRPDSTCQTKCQPQLTHKQHTSHTHKANLGGKDSVDDFLGNLLTLDGEILGEGLHLAEELHTHTHTHQIVHINMNVHNLYTH